MGGSLATGMEFCFYSRGVWGVGVGSVGGVGGRERRKEEGGYGVRDGEGEGYGDREGEDEG